MRSPPCWGCEPVRAVLITGFGPFPGMPRNPTAALALRLARLRQPALADLRREALILPTEWQALETLKARLAADPPDGVLMLGIAGRRRALNVEIQAVNAARGLDAARRRPDRRISPAGPPVRRFGSGAPALVHALRRSGLPAQTSRDAGRYLCNAVYFAALEMMAARDVPVVFVHLPGRGPAARAPMARQLVALSDLLRTLMRP